jgi:hypothetical protein
LLTAEDDYAASDQPSGHNIIPHKRKNRWSWKRP